MEDEIQALFKSAESHLHKARTDQRGVASDRAIGECIHSLNDLQTATVAMYERLTALETFVHNQHNSLTPPF